MTILIIAEHDNQTIRSATLSAVAAAAQLSNAGAGDIHVLIAGSDAARVADEAAKIAGVSNVLLADAPHFSDGLAENIAAQVLAIAHDYSHVLAAATERSCAAGQQERDGAIPTPRGQKVVAILPVMSITDERAEVNSFSPGDADEVAS